MKVIIGNIVSVAEEGGYDVVLQGCNCFHTQGAGVAKWISKQWPEVFDADKTSEYGSSAKLGSFTKAHIVRGSTEFDVYNLYTQHRYGPAYEKNFSYIAWESALNEVKKQLPDCHTRILFPLIGTGNGGGRWRHVRRIIEEVLGGYDLTLVKLR